MRTVDEIVAYYRQVQKDDLLGFTFEVLIPYLPVEHIREFVKDDSDLSEWKPTPLDRASIIAEMKEYMSFAWGKVDAHRGISAVRSVEKMQAWLWLLEDEETLAWTKDDEHYENYGAPILLKICQKYAFPIPADEEIRRMARGLPCEEGCTQGCGRV